jgi:hypothetical protein
LDGSNTYTGGTILSAGTLGLGPDGSISNSTAITIDAGVTMDASLINPFSLSASTSLTGSGATAPATIIGASGGTVSFGSQPIGLNFTPASLSGDLAHPALSVPYPKS